MGNTRVEWPTGAQLQKDGSLIVRSPSRLNFEGEQLSAMSYQNGVLSLTLDDEPITYTHQALPNDLVEANSLGFFGGSTDTHIYAQRITLRKLTAVSLIKAILTVSHVGTSYILGVYNSAGARLWTSNWFTAVAGFYYWVPGTAAWASAFDTVEGEGWIAMCRYTEVGAGGNPSGVVLTDSAGTQSISGRAAIAVEQMTFPMDPTELLPASLGLGATTFTPTFPALFLSTQ